MEHEAFGVIRVHELKPGGKLVPVRSYNFYAQKTVFEKQNYRLFFFQVNEENKKEYVKLYVTYRWCQGIEQQFL